MEQCLATDGENLRLSKVALEAQQSSYELIRETSDAGLASNLDLRQAQSQVESARVNVAAFTGAVAVDRNALQLLVGAPVGPDLSGLFGGATKTWSFAPQIVAPLFASGSLIANLKASKIDREIAVAQYEKAIQVAFAAVSDALTLRVTLVSQREAQEALVVALEQTWHLSDARTPAGIDGYLGVLVAQQAFYAAQRGEVGVRFAEQANLVQLYKVLGGGL